MDRHLRRPSENLLQAPHQTPELRVAEVLVLGVHACPFLDEDERIRSLDVFADAIALTAFLGAGLCCVHANEVEPSIALLGLDRDPDDLNDHLLPPVRRAWR